MIRCDKCGSENPDNSKFCGNCGAPIEAHNELYKCSKCGAQIHNKQVYCNKCGSKLIYSDNENEAFAIPVKKDVSKKTCESKTNSKVTNIIFASLCMLVSLLAIISIFLPPIMLVAKDYGSRHAESMSIEYWFSCFDAFDSFNEYMKALTIINFISFITSIGLVLPFAIIGIVKSIKSIVRKENFSSSKFVTIALAGALQYFLLTYMNFAAVINGGNASLRDVPGVGFIIAIISLFIYGGALIFKSIVQYKENHDSTLRSLIIKQVLMVLVICTTLFSFGTAFGVREGTYKAESSIYSLMIELSSANISLTIALVVLAYILQISLLVIALSALCVSLNNKKTISLAFPIILLIGFISFGVLSIHAFGNYQADLEIASDARLQEIIRGTKFGTPTIVGIVLSSLTLAASIVKLVFAKKDRA